MKELTSEIRKTIRENDLDMSLIELAQLIHVSVPKLCSWRKEMGLPKKRHRKYDLTGKRFYRLVCTHDDGGRSVTVRCDCGTVFQTSRYALVSGLSHSCGCFRSDILYGRCFLKVDYATAKAMADERFSTK